MKTLKTIAYVCLAMLPLFFVVQTALLFAEGYGSDSFRDANRFAVLAETNRRAAIEAVEEYIEYRKTVEKYTFKIADHEELVEAILVNAITVRKNYGIWIEIGSKYNNFLSPIPQLAIPVVLYLIFYLFISSHKEAQLSERNEKYTTNI